MHLRGFSPNVDAGSNARVHRFDKERESVDYERIDRTGGKHRFNRIAHEDEQSQDALEAWLALTESYAAPALHKLLDDHTKPTKAERFNLCMYIAFLGARTPHALAMSETLNAMSLDMEWGDDDA